jgi:hypothetical protein
MAKKSFKRGAGIRNPQNRRLLWIKLQACNDFMLDSVPLNDCFASVDTSDQPSNTPNYLGSHIVETGRSWLGELPTSSDGFAEV